MKNEERKEEGSPKPGFVVRGLDSEIRERLRQAVQATGGPRKFADDTGIPFGTLSDALQGRSEPRSGLVAAIAQRSGRSLDWLFFGTPETATSEGAPPAGGQLIPLPMRNVQASAGRGVLASPDQVLTGSIIGFNADFLRQIGVNPRFAEVLTARGDSMEPTIRDGDLLINDRSIISVVDNGIYVVVYAGLVNIKRVQLKLNGSIVLKSDNPLYDDEVVPPDEVHSLHIEGRIRWSGRPL